MLFFLRILGGWGLLAAVIALTDDVTRSYQSGAKMSFASIGKDWSLLSPGTLNAAQAAFERHAHMLWDPVLISLLRLPAFAVAGVLGVGLYAAGLHRRRLNIYAN